MMGGMGVGPVGLRGRGAVAPEAAPRSRRMKPRLFYAISPFLAAALAWSLHATAARPPEPAAAGAEPAAAGAELAAAEAGAGAAAPKGRPIDGRDWTWRLKPDGVVQAVCKGSVVMETRAVYWGPKWAWAGTAKPELTPAPGGGWTYRAEVPALKTRIEGEYRSPRPNELVMDLRLSSSEAMPDAVGGGLSWRLKPKAPALGGVAPKPKILPGNAGWTWDAAAGSVVRLAVEPGAAESIIEGDSVRTCFMFQGVQAGVKSFRLTLTLPEGATREPSPEERYDPAPGPGWFPGALAWDSSPVDLRSLNADDRPAGRRGRITADGDRLLLGDGSPARFWGANITSYSLFRTPHDLVPAQARRMAQLGYNLMRIHHHDSAWVNPNIFGTRATSTRTLDPESLAKIDWWIKCLRDEGIYVWLDIQVGRTILEKDGPVAGMEEIAKDKGVLAGYSYLNADVQRLMLDFQRAYLDHVNEHTGLAYKDDPAIAFVLLTNENELTHHFGNMFLPDKKRPHHGEIFMAGSKAFARDHDLPEKLTWRSWEGGPAMLYAADLEHRFNAAFLGDFRARGGRALAATTSSWGNCPLGSLASLLDGDVVDVHAYGVGEFLGVDPRYEPNYAQWIGAAQVAGRPLTITEWNVQYPAVDRFCSPLYTAALAAFQGWDAPMLFAYCQEPMGKPRNPTSWSTWHDPALTGMIPAAALLYRKGQVAPARGNFHMAFPADRFYRASFSPASSVALRTALEQRRLTVGVPATPALPWLKPTPAPAGAEVIEDPDRDLLADADSGVIRSDTGELTRDWKNGRHVVDAPHCQAVSGWIGGGPIATADARFEFRTKKAVVALNSVDDRPLSQSRFILVTAVARAVPDPSKKEVFVSEPVEGAITLKTEVPDLELMALAADGRVAGRSTPTFEGGAIRIEVPALGGTHWYVLKSKGAASTP